MMRIKAFSVSIEQNASVRCARLFLALLTRRAFWKCSWSVRGVAYFVTCLLAPTLLPAQETVWLSSMDLTKMTQGAGPVSVAEATPASTPKRILWLPDSSIREHPLSIAGTKFERGVPMYVKGSLWLELNGETERFAATVGVDDSSQQGPFVLPVNFRVYGDGKKLWESGPIHLGEPGRPLDLDLRGVKRLLLIADAHGYAAKFIQANWANARFLSQGEPPTAIAPPVATTEEILTPKPGPQPRINGPKTFGCRPGHPVIYRVPTTGTRPIQFSASHLPEGLQLDAERGIITGSVSKAGEYVVTLQAKNGSGSDSRPFKIICGDKLALTPPMGWNSWFQRYHYQTDQMLREGADIMVSSGMADVGYQYVSIDDGWSNTLASDDPSYIAGRSPAHTGPARDRQGNILPNKNFPDMKALTDYIHAKGLKAGLYSTPGPLSCGGFYGSMNHEEQDAAQFAAWGFDLLKYDWCGYRKIVGLGPHGGPYTSAQDIATLQKPYRIMGDILRRQNRDIVFNLCQYGLGDSWEWGAEVGGHYWRTSLDIAGYEYDHLFALALENAKHRAWSKPGSWNDPDFVMIGYLYKYQGPDLKPQDPHHPSELTRLTPTERYSYMSLWSLMAAPLVFSGDITKLDEFTLNVLCNPEVIDVDQDPLGQCARVIAKNGDTFIMVKDLEDGSRAIGLCNAGEWEATVTLKWADLDLKGRQLIRDLWRQKDCGEFSGEFTRTVPAHGVFLFRMTAVGK